MDPLGRTVLDQKSCLLVKVILNFPVWAGLYHGPTTVLLQDHLHLGLTILTVAHVALWYIHGAQSSDMVTALRPMYIPCSYMVPLEM